MENWSDTRAKLKAKFHQLTELDLLAIRQNRDRLVERLKIRLGKTEEEIQKLIHEIMS
jgi:hypothetical protein